MLLEPSIRIEVPCGTELGSGNVVGAGDCARAGSANRVPTDLAAVIDEIRTARLIVERNFFGNMNAIAPETIRV
jgi:hypothetical protein